jgi:hypothetical protein
MGRMKRFLYRNVVSAYSLVPNSCRLGSRLTRRIIIFGIHTTALTAFSASIPIPSGFSSRGAQVRS